ncbi:MAG: alpha/beta fold hydrolase [Myxococcales bacterium]|nr:alpha/beta fold hydrolase [Myxococcales bacterium]
MPLETVERETGPNPTASVIWLHGLGADGHDFEPIVPALSLAGPTRFVFPHAPVRPVTINGGMRMRAWYDIKEMSLDRRVDFEGIAASAVEVEALLAREKARGVPAERIVLAGFSQGGAVALHAGLRHAEALAGLLILSSYLPFADRVTEHHAANGQTPVFFGHGTFDMVVPAAFGRKAAETLEALGQPVSFATWPMAHAVHPDEVRAISGWLVDRLPAR